jgi:asparagine synthase (glutamine-hydrolysing)
MCGIAGIINTTANDHLMQKALDQLQHRGPDGHGIFMDKPLVLGHTRLAIQDLSSKAQQPMISADGRYIIIYNGEIYNHEEIRLQLTEEKIHFSSNCDTETLLYGYIQYGEAILEKLNGIFAFAIYDKEKRKLFAARDRMGVKPFYYYHDQSQFIFGSEIKTILELGRIEKSINYNALFQTLMLQWQMDDNTGFELIKKLNSGHCISIQIDQQESFSIKKWDTELFDGNYEFMSESAWIQRLDEELNKAVKRQLLSDKPIAYFLSGGLDSSLLIAIAKKIDPNKTKEAFCIAAGNDFSKEGFSDDLKYAKIVAEHLNINLNVIEAKLNFLDEFDQMIYHLEEAQADSAPLFVQQISKAAQAKGYNVLIGGVGGDDIFSGYRRHQAIAHEKWVNRTPLFVRTFIQKVIVLLPENSKTRRAKKLAEQLDKTSLQRMFHYFFWGDKNKVFNLFSSKSKTEINTENIEQYFKHYLSEIPNEKSRLNQVLHLETKSFLPCHNLNYTDKMGMAKSVEIRVPYLDNELVKLAKSMPPELKMKGATTKYLLKKVAEQYLPKEVIYRPKTGFGAPIRTWMQEDAMFQKEVWARLSNPSFVQRNIFEPKAVKQMFQDTVSKRKDYSYTLLGLLAIESWLRQFAD